MLSQKQKNKLIRDLNAASTTAIPKKLRKKAQTVTLNVLSGPSQSRPKRSRANGNSNGSVVSAPMRGVSNVLGQRTDIPLKQPFVGSESLGRFNGSIAFAETQFAINPGQAGTFPWLSREAALWEKYEFDKLEFEFRTTINEFSTNAKGRVILGVDYDASDPPPATRSQAEISRPVTAQAPYFNQRLVLRKEDMSEVCRYHYVRPGSLPGGSDIKFYDVGVLNFGTDGNINTDEVGELWVHYSGTFKNQVLESSTVAPRNLSVAELSDAGFALVSGATYVAIPLDVTDVDGIGLTNTAGAIVLPAGNYTLNGDVTVTATTISDMFIGFGDTNPDATLPGHVQAMSLTAGATFVRCALSTSVFHASNGTDPIYLMAKMIGTGSPSATANLVIQAV